MDKTKFNQWKSTTSVLRWFRGKEYKKRFLQFNITPDLLNRAFDWAATFTPITADDREIITHSKQSLLYFQGSPWVKQQNPEFNVGMGSYDGVECCDVVGLYLLSQIQDLGLNIGLYQQPHPQAEPADTAKNLPHLPAEWPKDPRVRGKHE